MSLRLNASLFEQSSSILAVSKIRPHQITRPSPGLYYWQYSRKVVNFVEFTWTYLNSRFSRNAWTTDRRTDVRMKPLIELLFATKKENWERRDDWYNLWDPQRLVLLKFPTMTLNNNWKSGLPLKFLCQLSFLRVFYGFFFIESIKTCQNASYYELIRGPDH